MEGVRETEIELATGGERLGRVTEVDLRQGLESGRFLLSDDAWTEGMAEWVKVRDLPLGKWYAQRLLAAPALSTSGPAMSEPGAPQPRLPILPQAKSQPFTAAGSAPAVESRMVQSILVTLLCCLPLGIVAIINASRVNTLLSVGDRKGAEHASAKASQYIKYSVIASGIWWMFYLAVLAAATTS